MNQFYAALFNGNCIAQIIAPIETTLEEARQQMLVDFDKCPTIHSVDFAVPFEVRSMIQRAEIVVYSMNMSIKCVVACTNSAGEPDFFAVTLSCSPHQYHNGEHYDLAKEKAEAHDYEGPFVVFDENDGPEFLFSNLFG